MMDGTLAALVFMAAGAGMSVLREVPRRAGSLLADLFSISIAVDENDPVHWFATWLGKQPEGRALTMADLQGILLAAETCQEAVARIAAHVHASLPAPQEAAEPATAAGPSSLASSRGARPAHPASGNAATDRCKITLPSQRSIVGGRKRWRTEGSCSWA